MRGNQQSTGQRRAQASQREILDVDPSINTKRAFSVDDNHDVGQGRGQQPAKYLIVWPQTSREHVEIAD